MKKTILWVAALAVVAAFIMPAEKSEATITILRDAGSLSRGKLPNERLNCGSSVTCQGFIDTSDFAPSASTNTLLTTISTNAVALANLQTAFSTNSLIAGNSNYVTLANSTQTKAGALWMRGLLKTDAGIDIADDVGSGTPGGRFRVVGDELQIRTERNGSSLTYINTVTGANTRRLSIDERGWVALGAHNPSGALSLTLGSITVSGSNSGITVLGGSITANGGTFISSTGFNVGGATITTLVNCDTIDTDAGGRLVCGSDDSGGAGGGNNQAVNTSTGLLITPAFGPVGGAIFLATSPFVSIPGKVFNTGVGTFNVVSVQGITMVVSTAPDANITMRIAQSTSAGVGFGDFSYISSSATVTSSSDTTAGGRYGVEYSTAFKMFPRMEYALHVTSVPAGGALPAENYGINVKGWWSP